MYCVLLLLYFLSQFRGRWQLSPAEGGPRPLKLTVRRDVLLGDAYKALGGAKQAIKGRLKVADVADCVVVLHPLLCWLGVHMSWIVNFQKGWSRCKLLCQGSLLVTKCICL